MRPARWRCLTSAGIEFAFGSSGNVIGGTTPSSRNVISGNTLEGISFHDSSVTGNLVQGNYIGTNATGSGSLGNGSVGVLLSNGASNNIIGGATGGAGNVISGNADAGILLDNVSGTTLQGNLIGADATGSIAVSNAIDGVQLLNASGNTIGGEAPGAGNTIAFNTQNGVNVISGTNNAIVRNSIHSNTLLGINLGTAGMTVNDNGDGDSGANNLQNFPGVDFGRHDRHSDHCHGNPQQLGLNELSH